MKTFLLPIILLLSYSLFAQNKGITLFQPDNNYILVPNNSAINVTNNFTIEFWMQPSKTESWAVILQEGKCSNSSSSYNVAINTDSTLSFTFNCSGNCNYAKSYKCSTKLYPGSCKHVAISYSSAGVKFYYNGLLQLGQYTTGTYCGNLKNSSEPLQIGVYRYFNETLGAYYDGLIDELRIWNIVLTPAEILANYQDTLLGNETGLKLYYKFDTNITGNGMTVTNYATATGSALNGLTYSGTTTSPSTTNSCFNYTDVDENLLGSADFSIFPNPTEGKFVIKTNNGINGIEIFNVLGENIYKNSDCRQSKFIEIDLSDYSKGIYFVKIIDEKKIFTQKIVLK